MKNNNAGSECTAVLELGKRRGGIGSEKGSRKRDFFFHPPLCFIIPPLKGG